MLGARSDGIEALGVDFEPGRQIHRVVAIDAVASEEIAGRRLLAVDAHPPHRRDNGGGDRDDGGGGKSTLQTLFSWPGSAPDCISASLN